MYLLCKGDSKLSFGFNANENFSLQINHHKWMCHCYLMTPDKKTPAAFWQLILQLQPTDNLIYWHRLPLRAIFSWRSTPTSRTGPGSAAATLEKERGCCRAPAWTRSASPRRRRGAEVCRPWGPSSSWWTRRWGQVCSTSPRRSAWREESLQEWCFRWWGDTLRTSLCVEVINEL